MELKQQDFDKLTIDETLDLIIEEAGELVQAAVKVKRFGSKRKNPYTLGDETNHQELVSEFQDLKRAFEDYMNKGHNHPGNPRHIIMMDEYMAGKLKCELGK